MQVHHILVEIVSAAANGTPGLGRYPPLKREVCNAIASDLQYFMCKISLDCCNLDW